jgi:hypothetical protein
LYPDAVNSDCGPALVEISILFYLRKPGVFTFPDSFADFIAAHFDYWGKLCGYAFRLGYDSRLGKNGLDFIARSENPAPAVENGPSLRFLGLTPQLLLCGNGIVVVVP